MLSDHDVLMSSIEPDASQAIYGSSHAHYVDIIQNIMKYSTEDSYDVAILNGIIGFGLNGEQIHEAALVLHRVIRPGGILVIGFNQGHDTCCSQFEPHFSAVKLGDLPAQLQIEDSPMSHVYATFKNKAKA